MNNLPNKSENATSDSDLVLLDIVRTVFGTVDQIWYASDAYDVTKLIANNACLLNLVSKPDTGS